MLQDTKAVIFDLDGTLIDSMWIWKDIDIEYLGRYGHDLPLSLQKEIEGMSFTETAGYFKRTFGIPSTIEEIKDTWIEMAGYKYRHEVPMKKGALEFLGFLRENGYKTGIATSNAKDLAEEILSAHGIRGCFDTIRTSCEVAAGKPAPDIYLQAAEDLHVCPDNCLVFEDIPNGILAGKNAGMKVCAVEDDFSTAEVPEKKQLADYYIHDYYEIIKNTYEVL